MEDLTERLGGGTVRPVEESPRSAVLVQGESFRAANAALEGGRVGEGAVDAPLWAEPVWALEATLPQALPRRTVQYSPLPEHPAAERDLALVGARTVTAAEMEEVLRDAGGNLLEAVWPFDLYEGKGIPEGERSLAWRLRFRHPERTLTDAEVDQAIEAILAALRERLDVRRR
jgi:phenylalanyl-tRNA synthetase beta chain